MVVKEFLAKAGIGMYEHGLLKRDEKGMQTERSPAAVSEEEDVILSCSTKCTLNDNPTYIWYKNGRQVTDGFTKVNKLYLDSVSNEELQQYSCAVGDPVNSTVFSHYTVTLLLFLPQFLIIAALWMWKSSSVTFIVCVNLHKVKIMNSRLSALILLLLIPGVSQSGCWDVTYTSRRVCALVNSTVDISCTYSHPSGHTVNKTFWHYGPSGVFKDLREEHQFAGRVEYVENKLRIKDLKISDSGEYRFRIITDLDQYAGSPGVILTVTGMQTERSPAAVSEEEDVILSCSTKCTLNDNPTYIWYKNGRQMKNKF
ncbi:sialoadhesin-like isoform X1 [Labeo rohita]|uniref:Sialoadhesin-like isoform X1 n=1 Tax=Labeo rohita TaxID=84645 RepID=A0A498L3M8_LABRO|nr:sialoadhesin-like isoform X1 [Labeo rohita]